ncbi:phage holin family protein [Heyndrickxia acidicola]|uniref:Phage holin family protein n=1 Tax=Heyndrickxia acidicola TaxID=209389 RepID=A0ABU6ML44_9BACI|nr:phage holin family protein [Heyndrickxia acidicola]MED1203760.1 phage holin family protein [Heyndrickxia acidicola]
MRWLLSILINAVLFIAIAGYLPGFKVHGFSAALEASFILSILNLLVRPILIILTLPITIVTLGFFLLFINAFTLVITDKLMGSRFDMTNFGVAFLVAVIMAVVNVVIQHMFFQSRSKR